MATINSVEPDNTLGQSEIEIDFEGELKCALSEIKKFKKEAMVQKSQVTDYEK